MTTTWADLDDQLVDMIGTAAPTSAAARITFWNLAQKHFAANHTADMKSVTILASGSSSEFPLPTDYLDLYAVFSKEQQRILESSEFWPGMAFGEDYNGLTPALYKEMPWGTIKTFWNPAEDAEALTVWYFALWPAVSGSTSEVYVPIWAHEALMCYVTALTYLGSVGDMSYLNEFKTRVDSGTPAHNPVRDAYREYRDRYEMLLKDRPRQIRRLPASPGGRN